VLTLEEVNRLEEEIENSYYNNYEVEHRWSFAELTEKYEDERLDEGREKGFV
jgi:hypothetical protein